MDVITKRKHRSRKPIVVAISGGFDPLHYGHIKYIQSAKKLGDHLTVIINNDDFLIRKKGYYFLPQHERANIVREIKGVDEVFISHDEDDTVCQALLGIKPQVFANGGDRQDANVYELRVCEEIYCQQVFGIGGYNKENSSSWIIEKFIERFIQAGNTVGNGTV